MGHLQALADEADSGDQSKHTLSCLIRQLQILDGHRCRPQSGLAVGGGGCGTMTTMFHPSEQGIRVEADLHCAFAERGFATRYATPTKSEWSLVRTRMADYRAEIEK